MKIFLAFIVALLFAFPVQAEKLKPPGWTASGNNQTTGNTRTSGMKRYSTGNAERTPAEEKAFRKKIARELASGNAKVIKRQDGTTAFERKIVLDGKSKTDSFWSNLFN